MSEQLELTNFRCLRPISGKLNNNPSVRVNISQDTKIKHEGNYVFAVEELDSVKLTPPTLKYRTVRVKLNPFIAHTDLEQC